MNTILCNTHKVNWSIKIGKLSIGYQNKGITYRNEGGNNVYYLTDTDLGKFLSCFQGGYSESNLITLFQNIPEVFAPIDAIASRVANGNFQLRDKTKLEPIDNDKLWQNITNRPNWRQTFRKFIYDAIVYKYVTGNRYFYTNVPNTLIRKSDNIVALWLLPSQYISIYKKQTRPKLFATVSVDDIVSYYEFNAGIDRQQFMPESIFHDIFIDIDYNREDILKGVSPLMSCEYPMSNLIAVYQARNKIYVKQGALGMIVSKKSDAGGSVALTPKEKEEVRKDYFDTYGLTGNKDTMGLTAFPIDFIRMGMSISELEPFVETEQSAAAIYTALGVPTDLMPRKDNSTFENMKSAERNLYQNVCIREANELAKILTHILGYESIGKEVFVSFDHIEVLQENKKEKAEVDWRINNTYKLQFINGIITLNQWKTAIGGEENKNALYDKLIFDMTPEELQLIKSIISIKAPAIAGDNNNQNDNNNGTSNS